MKHWRYNSINLTHDLIVFLVLVSVGQNIRAQQLSAIDGVTPAGIAPGSPAGSYPLSGFEHYNPFNGALNPAIPLYHVGGRGEAGFDLVWNFQQTWVAAKRYGGASPLIPIDPYPSNNIEGYGSAAALLGAGLFLAGPDRVL